jgi:RNA recognition motif-containing protein
MNLYVGGIPFAFNDDDLERLFSAHGAVTSAQVILDRDTGRSRGFGFVEMPNDDEARQAIQELDGSNAGGRRITVNEARPRSGGGSRPRDGGGGGSWGGGSGGGYQDRN